MRPVAASVPACLFLTVVVLVGAACSSSSDGSGNGAGTGTGSGDDGSGAGEPAAESGITAAHNAVRASVMPAANPAIPALTWSSTVAAAAQTWASGCSFAHGGVGSYGQNIYAGSGDTAPADVVAAWAAESTSYDYATNSCASGATCGHYTQVVWRDSTQLGCGVATCTTGSPFGSGSWQLWVCDYAPAGNVDGQSPY